MCEYSSRIYKFIIERILLTGIQKKCALKNHLNERLWVRTIVVSLYQHFWWPYQKIEDIIIYCDCFDKNVQSFILLEFIVFFEL